MRTGSYWEYQQVERDQLRKLLRSGWVVVGDVRRVHPHDPWGTNVTFDEVMVKRHVRIADGATITN